jgi:pilus assembly protein CpaF
MDTLEIYRHTTSQFLRPIKPLLDDPAVSEVLVNGPDTVFYEKAGRLHRSELKFPDPGALLAAARNIAEFVNRRIDADHPSCDARLPDGSRVHIIIAPASRQGVCLSIRRFQKSTFDLGRLVERGSVTAEAAEFLELCVMLHKNTVVSGGTGTGKTSLLNALSTAIPEQERIIVIEDTNELQLNQPHTVYLEAQPARPNGRGQVTIRDLFVDSLRMRPDRIVVGEIRRGEALDLIQSMLSGHAGSLTTVHANTPRDAAVRLETLCLMSDVGLPAHVARMQVAPALHVVVQIARYLDGSRRVQTISEMLGLAVPAPTAEPPPTDRGAAPAPPSLDDARRRAWFTALAGPAVLGPAWAAGMSSADLPEPLGGAAGFVLLAALSAAAVVDLHSRRIPNWCTYGAFLWAVLLNAGYSAAAAGLADPEPLRRFLGAVGLGGCLGGFAACFAGTFAVYRFSGGGAGDVKLAGAIGALLGFHGGVRAVLAGYIAAGVGALVWAIIAYGPLTMAATIGRRVGSRLAPGWVAPPDAGQETLLARRVPLAPFFAVGTLASVTGVFRL